MVTVVQIERKHGLTPSAFAREHLRGAAKPLIVTGAIERWTARSKWTFEFMKAAYGSIWCVRNWAWRAASGG